jgi:hypothetical protein
LTTDISKRDWNRLRKKAALLGRRKGVRMSRLPKKRGAPAARSTSM